MASLTITSLKPFCKILLEIFLFLTFLLDNLFHVELGTFIFLQIINAASSLVFLKRFVSLIGRFSLFPAFSFNIPSFISLNIIFVKISSSLLWLYIGLLFFFDKYSDSLFSFFVCLFRLQILSANYPWTLHFDIPLLKIHLKLLNLLSSSNTLISRMCLTIFWLSTISGYQFLLLLFFLIFRSHLLLLFAFFIFKIKISFSDVV